VLKHPRYSTLSFEEEAAEMAEMAMAREARKSAECMF
jgi:hypothetical protein